LKPSLQIILPVVSEMAIEEIGKDHEIPWRKLKIT